MTQKAKSARLLAASTVCVFGALSLSSAAQARDDTIKLAASDSYWCRMFPKYCGDESTPGGTQLRPDAMPEEGARGMAPADEPAAEEAPAKAASPADEDKQAPTNSSGE